MSSEIPQPTASVEALLFRTGERIRINSWIDQRESGWEYGTVIGEPVDCFGELAQRVSWDSGYESLMAISLFERVDYTTN